MSESRKGKGKTSGRKAVEPRAGVRRVGPAEATREEPQLQSPNKRKERKDDSLLGYVHSVSPMKRNRQNTVDYLTLTLQTDTSDYKEAVCFSKSKRALLLERQDSHTPVKITSYTNSKDAKKIIINDMTRISEADRLDYSFQYNALVDSTPLKCIEYILQDCKPMDMVSVKGKVVWLNESTMVGQKKLRLAKARLSDSSKHSITIELWEEHIAQVAVGKIFKFEKVRVRFWNSKMTIDTTKETVISPVDDETLAAIPELASDPDSPAKKSLVVSDIYAVESVQKNAQCIKCSRKIIQVTGSAIVVCEHCKCTMKSKSCIIRVRANVIVQEVGDNENTINHCLYISDDVLQKILGDRSMVATPEETIAEKLLLLENVRLTFDDSGCVSNLEQV